jgi:hypothetical protein
VIGTRILVWFSRHPMFAVLVALVTLTLAAIGLAMAFTPTSSSPSSAGSVPTDVRIASSGLPSPTSSPPPGRVEAAHRALHDLGRACEIPILQRDEKTVLEPLGVLEQFARDYPGGGFSIDDEPGSTVALLIVVRVELRDCDPTKVARIEALIPPQYLGD